MKLHREVTIAQSLGLAEAQGPVSVILSLDEIIKAGKVTNPYHIYVLGWLSEFFKNGLKSIDLELESPISFESGATSTAVVDSLKSMSPENQVQLALYLKDCIAQGESALYQKDSSVPEWMSYVIHKQD